MESSVREKIVEELRVEWKSLWRDRVDDKVRAEGIADKDYPMLFVDKGTIIFATKKFKPLEFGEILRLHNVACTSEVLPPPPTVGGWGKFVRTTILGQKRFGKTKRAHLYMEEEKQRQQLKKGGRGWLHF